MGRGCAYVLLKGSSELKQAANQKIRLWRIVRIIDRNVILEATRVKEDRLLVRFRGCPVSARCVVIVLLKK
jgi:hypothetical protein